MGFFDFLKRKKKEADIIRNIKKDNLEEFLAKEKEAFSLKERQIYNLIGSKKEEIIKNLEEKKRVLENLDLKEKKADERTKLIVKENLNYFIVNLEKLIFNLKNLNENSFKEFIGKLNQFFTFFEKKSFINYEKATFIIGNELGSVNSLISKFLAEINEIILENNEIFENIKRIDQLMNKLEDIDKGKKRNHELNEEIDKISNKISDYQNENKFYEKKIKGIENSSAYKQEIDNQIMINEKNGEYEKNIYKLRELLDFKYLISLSHQDAKTLSKIKEFQSDFKNSIENSKDFIINLYKKFNLNSNIIEEYIKKLRSMKNEIDLIDKKQIEADNIREIKIKIKDNIYKIENLELEKSKILKSIIRINEDNKESLEDLKKDLNKIGIMLVES